MADRAKRHILRPRAMTFETGQKSKVKGQRSSRCDRPAIFMHRISTLNDRKADSVRPDLTRRDWTSMSGADLEQKSGSSQVSVGLSSMFQNPPTLVYFKSVQKDCVRLKLVLFSSIGRRPTSATERSTQLDFEAGTICWQTSDRLTCQITLSDSRWRRFYLVSGTKAHYGPLFKLFFP